MTAEILGNTLEFVTNEKVFSPSGIDRGTLAMLSKITFSASDRILDLGCGYGVVGIAAAKIVGPEKVAMCDISEDAIELSRINAGKNSVNGVKIILSDGLNEITEDKFTLIISNPPYHTDFSVAKRFIEDGWKKLAYGGRMFMVTKRLDWYKNKLKTVFGGVKVYEVDGYYVFEAEKRVLKKSSENSSPKLSKKLARKQIRTSRTRNSQTSPS